MHSGVRLRAFVLSSFLGRSWLVVCDEFCVISFSSSPRGLFVFVFYITNVEQRLWTWLVCSVINSHLSTFIYLILQITGTCCNAVLYFSTSSATGILTLFFTTRTFCALFFTNSYYGTDFGVGCGGKNGVSDVKSDRRLGMDYLS
ncbi:hypothetical protein P167DRAFT_308670 [Morchella conica CCBAS932]|uniref:Uncharacterized protein n=1 Tax=Morchella conica CCBAS932 TaxID=1392247 RepID=A0A3N4KIS5_9PEZI|nr:hypothetical protein P167DRAFT_308670 [Morchella conica CCBAS932]